MWPKSKINSCGQNGRYSHFSTEFCNDFGHYKYILFRTFEQLIFLIALIAGIKKINGALTRY